MALAGFYSQHGEDRWIDKHVILPPHGIAVEVGAGDGVALSNTLHWEDLGWDGLLVEPDPRNLAGIETRRRWPVFRGVISDKSGWSWLMQQPEPTLSGLIRPVGEPLRVPAIRLGELVNAYQMPRIDLLSIDTEGTELEVWHTLACEFDEHPEYRPQVVIVEHWTQDLCRRRDELIAEFEQDYALGMETECNLVFVSKRPCRP